MSAAPDPVEPTPPPGTPAISETARRARERLHDEIDRVRRGVEEMLDDPEQEHEPETEAKLRRELAELRIEAQNYVKVRVDASERRLEKAVQDIDTRADMLERKIHQAAADREDAEVPRREKLRELDAKAAALEQKLEEAAAKAREAEVPRQIPRLEMLVREVDARAEKLEEKIDRKVAEVAAESRAAALPQRKKLKKQRKTLEEFVARTEKIEAALSTEQDDRDLVEAPQLEHSMREVNARAEALAQKVGQLVAGQEALARRIEEARAVEPDDRDLVEAPQLESSMREVTARAEALAQKLGELATGQESLARGQESLARRIQESQEVEPDDRDLVEAPQLESSMREVQARTESLAEKVHASTESLARQFNASTASLAQRIEQVDADRREAEMRIHKNTEQLLDDLLKEVRTTADRISAAAPPPPAPK